MAKIIIDGKVLEFREALTIIQAADRLGVEIPRLCYHPALSTRGACRLCLVEIENQPKLATACSTPAQDGMIVRTDTPKVLSARRRILEFIMLNHPLDCPVCDQCGDCTLQNYYMKYNLQNSRLQEGKIHKTKRQVVSEHLILDAERCVLCGRCVRFMKEVAKEPVLDFLKRGERTELTILPNCKIQTRYSMCLVDVCPVGAWTSRDFRFKTRPWFLKTSASVCPGCARSCNVFVDYHPEEGKVYRLRPRFNPEVNNYWMCDTGRLCYHRFETEERLTNFTLREKEDTQETDAESALRAVAAALKKGSAAILVDANATNEEFNLLNRLARQFCEGRVFVYAPADETPWGQFSDDTLIMKEKFANLRGTQEAGIKILDKNSVQRTLDDIRNKEIKTLLLLGTDLADQAEASKLFSKLEFFAVLDYRPTASSNVAHVVLPSISFFENEGTVVNGAGRVQKISAGATPPGKAQMRWKMLAQLFALCKGGKEPLLVEEIFENTAQTLKAFRNLNYDKLGEFGAPLA